MKKLLWVLPLTLFLWGCEKDGVTPDRTDTDQNKYGKVEDGVKKPVKLYLYSIAIPSENHIQCLPEIYGDLTFPMESMIGGSGTHLGDLQMDKSTLIFDGCQFGPGPGQVTTPGHGTLTADNGDELYYTTVCTYQAPEFTMTGTVILTGGTGRFMGCYGETNVIGKVDKGNGTAIWTSEGYIIFKK
jgi:hypothetical protein